MAAGVKRDGKKRVKDSRDVTSCGLRLWVTESVSGERVIYRDATHLKNDESYRTWRTNIQISALISSMKNYLRIWSRRINILKYCLMLYFAISRRAVRAVCRLSSHYYRNNRTCSPLWRSKYCTALLYCTVLHYDEVTTAVLLRTRHSELKKEWRAH